MGPSGIAVLTFVTIVGVIVAVWWAVVSAAAMRARISGESAPVAAPPVLLREDPQHRFAWLRRLAGALSLDRRLAALTARAGLPGKSGEVLALVLALGAAGGAVGLLRTGQILWMVLCAAGAAALPIVYLQRRASKRIDKFSEQFPDALDMMQRALRAGYAISGAFKVVAEEMPNPVGVEFQQVFQAVSLGKPADEALKEMHGRLGTEDLRFFQAAVSIQREVGGNLAEILENLSHVIRDRFRVLSYAKVLSAQHRATAYCVAASPLVLAVMFTLMSPGFFDPLLSHPIARLLIGAAVIMQVIGFIALKKIATITV